MLQLKKEKEAVHVRILVTGGGTGGHVTPLRPIVRSLKARFPDSEITFVSKRGDTFAALLDDEQAIDVRYSVISGKFRRYPNMSILERLLDFKTNAFNVRDLLLIEIGLIQSVFRLAFQRPDVIFSKGGPASIPLGIMAKIYNIPLVTHDSDIIPGWTHRLVGKWAAVTTVASEAGEYPYDVAKTRVVGVPVGEGYTKDYTIAQKNAMRKKLHLPNKNPVIFVLGGSLGAKSINDAMIANAKNMIDAGWHVVHVSGSQNYEDVSSEIETLALGSSYTVTPFIADPETVLSYYICADVVVSRCGATNTAEISNLGKATVLIPAKQLADQIKNGEYYKDQEAAIVLSDQAVIDNPSQLFSSLDTILTNSKVRSQYETRMKQLAIPDTARQITDVISEIVSHA